MEKKSKAEKLKLRGINQTILISSYNSGAGTGPNDCMTEEVYQRLNAQGALDTTVYVCGIGWMTPDVTIYGSGSGFGSGCGSEEYGSGSGSDYWGSGSGSGSGWSGGGAGGESGGTTGGGPSVPSEKERIIKRVQDEVYAIYKKEGVNAYKYVIRINEETCDTNARTLSDGTIEVCTKFFEYNFDDQVSIIWHEIYHLEHNHNLDSKREQLGDASFELQPDKETMNFLAILINWEVKDITPGHQEYIRQILLNDFLLQTYKMPAQWYRNEIETHEAELNNGIVKSERYEALLKWQLWKFNEMLKRTKD